MALDRFSSRAAGEKAGKTLVGKDEPSIWHEALSSLASLPLDESDIAVDEWALERLRNEAEAALANEAKIFEQDLGEALLSGYPVYAFLHPMRDVGAIG